MSATISLHGSFSAGARLDERRSDNDLPPFVTLEISTSDASVNLIDVKAAGLDALAEAVAAARKVLPS